MNNSLMTETIYTSDEWDQYASSHLRITAPVQSQVYRASAELMEGSVVDFGCGSGKLAPFLCQNKKVNSYLGIDCSIDMTNSAQWLVKKLAKPNYKVRCAEIQQVTGVTFSSAVCINSFYAWPNPLNQLRHITSLLKIGGIFVLANPNRQLNMAKLLHEALPELIAHPDFEQFSEQNLSFAENQRAHFLPMNDLVDLARDVGFKIIECHQRFFNGGLNFLILERR